MDAGSSSSMAVKKPNPTHKAIFMGMHYSTIVVALGALIAFFIFGVYFLYVDYSICGNASGVWIFALVALLWPFTYLIIGLALNALLGYIFLLCTKEEESTWNMRSLISALLVLAGLVAYGSYVIFFSDVCENEYDAGIWIFVEVTTFSAAVLGALLLLIILLAAFGILEIDLPPGSSKKAPILSNSPSEGAGKSSSSSSSATSSSSSSSSSAAETGEKEPLMQRKPSGDPADHKESLMV